MPGSNLSILLGDGQEKLSCRMQAVKTLGLASKDYKDRMLETGVEIELEKG
jgi:hypothetical protein